MSYERRFDTDKVIMSTGLTVASFYTLPDDMEQVLRTYTPEACDSAIVYDALTGAHYFLSKEGKRCVIEAEDVRIVMLRSMNLPGHGPIFGEY